MSYEGRMFGYRKTGTSCFVVYANVNNMPFLVLEYDKATGIFTDEYAEGEYTTAELMRELQRTAKWAESEYPDIDFHYENGEEGGIVKNMIYDAEHEGEGGTNR